jgi:hypothetical protein
VLLSLFREACEKRGWITIAVRALQSTFSDTSSEFERLLSMATERAVRQAYGKPAERRTRVAPKFSATGKIPFTGIDLTLDHAFSSADYSLEKAIYSLISATGELGVPVVFIVDEADFVRPRDAELIHLLLLSTQPRDGDYPATLMAAGCSRTIYRDMQGESSDADWTALPHYIERLSDEDSEALLVRTAALAACDWTTVDLRPLLLVCAGIPRRLQSAGSVLMSATRGQVIRQTLVDTTAKRIEAPIRAMPLAFDEIERRAVRILQATMAESAQPLLDDACKAMSASGIAEPLKLIDRLQDVGWLEIDDAERLYGLA